MARGDSYVPRCRSCETRTEHISGRCRKCRLQSCAICLTSFDPSNRVSDRCAPCDRRIEAWQRRGVPDAVAQLKAHYRRLDGDDDFIVCESDVVIDGRLTARNRKAT